MRGHNICFCREIRKIIFELSLIPTLIWSSGQEVRGYGAGSPRKVVSLNLGLAIQRLENSVIPALNGNFFESRKDEAVKGEG